MEAADETRKHWASLLAGEGPLHNAALGTWLGLAALALGAASSADISSVGSASLQVAAPDGETEVRSEPAEAVGWAAALSPIFAAWTEAFDNLQGSAWPWLPLITENPLARFLSHPVAVVGGENSTSQLAARAGLALIDFLQVAMTHQALQAQGWMKAMQRFAADFRASSDGDAGHVVVASLDDLVTHWGTVGEAVLQGHSRSEPFLRSQAAMLRKAMHYRVAQRQVMEAALRANDLPTLADLDEAFASIHALRSEIRELRRLAQSAASAVAADVPVPEQKATPGNRARDVRGAA